MGNSGVARCHWQIGCRLCVVASYTEKVCLLFKKEKIAGEIQGKKGYNSTSLLRVDYFNH